MHRPNSSYICKKVYEFLKFYVDSIVLSLVLAYYKYVDRGDNDDGERWI